MFQSTMSEIMIDSHKFHHIISWKIFSRRLLRSIILPSWNSSEL